MSVLPARANAALLGVFWFGIQVVWGAILSIALQARSVALAPREGLRDYAVLAAVGALLAAAVQIGIGPLADRRRGIVGHRLEFYALGVGAALPTLGWFFVAPAYWQLVVAFLVLQVTMNVAVGPYQAVIPDYVACERTGTASSWLSVYQFLGNTLGVVMAGFVRDFRLLALGLIAILGSAFAVTASHAGSLRGEDVAPPIRPFALTPNVLTLVVSRGFVNLGSFTLLGFMFFYVKDSLHAPDVPKDTALIFLAFTISGITGAILSATPSNHGDKRLIVTLATAVTAGALLLFAQAQSVGAAALAAVFAGGAWGAFITADWALAVGILPEGAMASAMSVWNLAAAVPQIVAPLLSWPLVQAGNAYSPGLGPRLAFILVVVEFTIGTLWLWRLPSAVVGPRARAERSLPVS